MRKIKTFLKIFKVINMLLIIAANYAIWNISRKLKGAK